MPGRSRGAQMCILAGCAFAVSLPSPAASQPREAPAAESWTPARTPDGQPDMQGTWTNGTLTPFERPANLAGKAFLTGEEAADIERQAAERRANPNRPRRPGDVGGDNEAFVDSGYKVTVDPADLARRRSRRPRPAPARSRADSRRQRERRRLVRDDEPMGPLHHAQHHGPLSGRLQQRLPDHPVARLRGHPRGDDSRGANHPARRRVPTPLRACARGWATRADGGRARRSSSIRPTSSIADGSRPMPVPGAFAVCRRHPRCTWSSALRAPTPTR